MYSEISSADLFGAERGEVPDGSASLVFLCLQRMGFQEEISEMSVAALCTDVQDGAPHLLAGCFLHSW